MSKITQQQIADNLGVTKDTVSKWLKGKTAPTTAHRKLLEVKYPELLCKMLVARLKNKKEITRNSFRTFGRYND